MSYGEDPQWKVIRARFASRCAVCTGSIWAGDRVAWSEGRGVVCQHCHRAGRLPKLERPKVQRVHARVVEDRMIPAWVRIPSMRRRTA